MLGDHRELEPPDPLPNSEVKRLIADGSVGLPHVRVGHRQALNNKPRPQGRGFLLPVGNVRAYFVGSKIKTQRCILRIKIYQTRTRRRRPKGIPLGVIAKRL